ncbi:MAG: c-type cytochrome [Chloroflexi bacterium]|nr:c-type cytochrome [Chloroflexota bacterium]
MIRRLLFAAAAALLLAACSGLAGEPRVVATIPAATPAPTEPAFPASRPDVALGAALYAENCVRCHGLTGAGDGEFALTGQVQNVASFQDPATSFEQEPHVWFQTITNGRIDKLMPPWQGTLSFEERWAVAMYTYTLHSTEAQIAHGRELFQAECVDCHGETGQGDGPRAAELSESPGDLSDHVGMIYLSDSAMAVSIREGIGDVMPAQGIEFGGEWNEEDIRSVVDYVRTLSLENPSAGRSLAVQAALAATAAPTTQGAGPEAAQATVPPPVATEEVGCTEPTVDASSAEAASIPDTVRITGQVTMASAGGTLPESLPIALFAFDPSFNRTQTDGVAAADGTFAFEDVPYAPGSSYIMTVNYRDRVFASDLRRGQTLADEAATGALDLSVIVYDLTDDPSVISISGMVSQVTVTGDSVEVAQVFSVRNTSDRAFTSGESTAEGAPISLIIPLPPGAVVVSLLGGENRFLVADDSSALIDTALVLPGEEHIINVIYLVPYGGGAIIEQEINYPFSGTARLLVRPTNLGVIGPQFPSLGPETIGTTQFAAYGSTLELEPAGVLRYELTGAAAEAGTVDRGTGVVSANNLPVVIAIVLIIAGLIALAIYVITARNRTTETTVGPQQQIDALAAAIADLDAEFEAGRVEEADYQTQRAALKARMARLMKG